MPECDWCIFAKKKPEAIAKVRVIGGHEENLCGRHKSELEMGTIIEAYNEEKLENILGEGYETENDIDSDTP